MAIVQSNFLLWPEEDPVGEVINNSPAQPPSRPVLRLFREGLSPDLDPTGTLSRQLLSGRDLVKTTRRHAHQAGHSHQTHQGRELESLVTALPALDQLLAGGLDRGRLVELVGRRSSGRFSAVLAALAAATACGEAAALVDLGDGLDPRIARASGVHLEHLLWVRPRRLKEALRAAELLLATGFPLVVVELGLPPVVGGRGSEAFWLRLARAAQERNSALLISAPYRVSGTAANAVLQARALRPRWAGGGKAPRLLVGAEGSLALEKHRSHDQPPGQTAPLPLNSPDAIPQPNSSTPKGPDSGGRSWEPVDEPLVDHPGQAEGSQHRPKADGTGGEKRVRAVERRQRKSSKPNSSTPKGPDSGGRSWEPSAGLSAQIIG